MRIFFHRFLAFAAVESLAVYSFCRGAEPLSVALCLAGVGVLVARKRPRARTLKYKEGRPRIEL